MFFALWDDNISKHGTISDASLQKLDIECHVYFSVYPLLEHAKGADVTLS